MSARNISLKNGILSSLDQITSMALNNSRNIPDSEKELKENTSTDTSLTRHSNGHAPPASNMPKQANHIAIKSFPSIPPAFCPKSSLINPLSPRGTYLKPRLDTIPDSPRINHKINQSNIAQEKNINQCQTKLNNGLLDRYIPEKSPDSPVDNFLSSHESDNQLNHNGTLRKHDPSATLRYSNSRDSKLLGNSIPSRRNSTGQHQGNISSTQTVTSTSHTDLEAQQNQSNIPENNLSLPKDLTTSKTRSESALSTFSPNFETEELRRNSSDSSIIPSPETLISSYPRRNSAWTAEVLSIEIQVDYVMDPNDLWGKLRHKQTQDDNDNIETVIFQVNNMEPLVSENGEKNYKTLRTAEVGVVLPMVAGSAGDDGERNGVGKRSEDISNDNSALPEKVDTPTNHRLSHGSDDLNLPPREHWENRFQFLLSTIGYAVDLSNVWRFPFLCYKNGGGAFLIPYFTTLIFGAMPVFFLEMCIGQFNRCGPTAVWEKMAPMFKGIGIASCFMAYIVAFYYNVIIGWSFFYLFASFTSKLPWTTCFNDFNSENCWQIDWDTNITSVNYLNEVEDVTMGSTGDADPRPFNRTYNITVSVSSTMEYFERGMLELDRSSGLEDLGVVRWQLALCTLLTFTLLYFCLWKGVKSTGKVVYVTATLPYVIMTILLVRGVLLPGAEDGIRYFITPKIDSLRRPKVWIDAAVQIFFSVGSGFGTHIAYASYNKFHNNCKRDCIVTVIVNSFTSLFSGFVIFSYLGYMSLKTHKDIDKVATEGPGLVFIVYPEAIATLPGSVGWAIIFFFMLLALGLDSAFGGLESPLTGIRDELSQLMKYRYFREVLTFLIILSAFIFSIPCIMQGGMYVFTILDTFAAGTSIVFIVLCEVVAVSWFYGLPQFCADVEKMTGEKPNLYWRICWKFICPFLLTIIVASSIISYQPLTYRTSQGIYTYPFYANIIGWCIACSSMSLVPGYILYRLVRNKGSCSQRFALAMSPQCEHEEILQKKVVKRFQRKHWFSI